MSTTTAVPTHLIPQAFIGKCPRCAATVAVSRTLDEHGASRQQAPCACGYPVLMFFVDGRYGKRECGDWCTEGTGRKCTCACGGSQHGLAWRVK